MIDDVGLRRALDRKRDELAFRRAWAAKDSPRDLRFTGAIEMIDTVLRALPRFVVDLGGPSPHNVRNTDPEDAQVAASNTFGRSKNRMRVYVALQELGEGTAEQIAAKAIEMFPGVYPPYSLARRVTDLHERGLIERTGEKRRTQAGGSADVWRMKGNEDD